ncbi:MAG: hypothetical protein ACRD4K_12920, partial [Candidatus Acidiferrales bacterium]
MQTGWVARVVLLILLLFSLISWAVIFQKWSLFGRLESHSRKFLQMFRAGGLPDPRTVRAAASDSPMVRVYEAGVREMQAQLSTGNPPAGKIKNSHAIAVEMHLASAEEV